MTVRIAPKASANRIVGVAPQAEGGAVLKVTVTAVPEGGKANAALIKLLAKSWRIPKSAIEVAVGATGRRKVLKIAGESEHTMAQLTKWLEELDG